MIFLPIVERELRVATRKWATYWSRVFAALVAVAITVWMLGAFGTLVAPDLLGARMFKALANLAFFWCLSPGLVLTADCLSREKREGTLGFLFLTDLKGHDVVLAKLAATSLRAFYSLLAVFPLMAIPFFVGGVTVGEFWRMVLVLGNTLFFSLATGMLVSALSWREQRAMFGTVCLLVLATVILPALGPVFASASPVTAFVQAYDAPFLAAPIRFCSALVTVHAMGWIFLTVASRALPRSWQEKFLWETSAQKPGDGRLLVPRRSERRRLLLENKPAEWFASHNLRVNWIWASLGMVVLVWLAGNFGNGWQWWNPVAIGTVALCLHATLQFWVAWESSRRLNEARRLGALEQVLSTPVSVPELLHGQMLSLERQFGPPVLAVAALNFSLLLLARRYFPWNPDDAFGFSMFIAATAGVMVVNAYALARLGLWQGLKSSHAAQATLQSLVWMVVLPTGFFMLVLYLVLTAVGPGIFRLLAGSAVLWAAITAANACAFHSHASRKLRTEFREQAALASGRKRSPVNIAGKKLFSGLGIGRKATVAAIE